MRILLIHSDHMEWSPEKKAMKQAEEVDKKPVKVGNALVVFSAVEKPDERDSGKIIEKTVAEILDVFRKVKAENIVVYPYAHLSSDLASPGMALEVLKGIEKSLVGNKISVKRAPFGWYKKFSINCKGHPLSELARHITLEEKEKRKARPATKIILDRKALPSNDHRVLGQDLKIFTFADEVGAGLPLWMPNGEILRHELMEYMRGVEHRYGYKYVSTPVITKGRLYEQTGHLPYYKDSMYSPLIIDDEEFYLRPMNCPHHHMVFRELVTSYRDLPLRLAEPGMTYRKELSGVTYGLIRAMGFCQNDAHLYVRPDQLKKEFVGVMELFREVYKTLGIKGYWFRLSLPDFNKKPDKFTGDKKEWEWACKEIRNAMKDFGEKFVEEKGEASFYGPKIDVQIKNTLGKEETIATCQVDVVVPRRLGLTYTDKDDKKKHVIIIHRAVTGSYERFVAYLLEQTKGCLPLWLAPVQVRVLSFTERNVKSVEKFARALVDKGIRAESDVRDHTVDYKVRDGELQRIPYLIVIGDKEEKAGTLAVRKRGKKGVDFGVKPDGFIDQVLKEIKSKN